MKTATLMLCSFLTLILISCDESSNPVYMVHYSAGASFDDKSVLIVVSNDEMLRVAVENVLIDRKFVVKDLNSYKHFFMNYKDQYVENAQTETGVDKYNGGETLNDRVKQVKEMKGDQALFDQMMQWNDLKLEMIRVEDYKNLEQQKYAALHEVYKFLGITHALVVETREGKNGLTVVSKLISIPSDRVLFTMYFEVNHDGLNAVASNGYRLSKVNDDGQDLPQAAYIRFADFLVEKLAGTN